METAGQYDDSVQQPEAMQQWVVVNLGVAAAMGLIALGCHAFHLRFIEMSAWLPTGVAVGAVLVLGNRLLPGVFAGAFVQMLALSQQPLTALLYGSGLALACAVIRRLLKVGSSFDGRLDRIRATTFFVLVAMGVTLAMSLLLAPADALLFQQQIHGTGAAEGAHHPDRAMHPPAPGLPSGMAEEHASGHGHGSSLSEHQKSEAISAEPLGVLLMAPLVLWLWHARRNPELPRFDQESASALAIFALLIGVTVAIYSGFLEDQFGLRHTTLLVLPPAVWLALSYGTGYTLIGNLAVFFIVGMGTSLGYGPFKDHSSGLHLLTAVYCVTTLLIAAGRSERLTAEAQIHRLATRDALTGLPNRHLFDIHMARTMSSARRYGRKIAVIFIDLDYFKQVNDTLGHDVGDALLIQAAQRLQASLRMDSMLSRFGGDEFIAQIDNIENAEALQPILNRIVEAMKAPFEVNGHICSISCSGGISIFPDHGETTGELLKKADIAMYEVKSSGRNGFRFFGQEMHGYLDAERR